MAATKSKSTDKSPKRAPTPPTSTPYLAATRLNGRNSISHAPKKSIDWVNLHFSERRGYKRVHIGHKYNPNEHAVLCQKLRVGKLGSGYFMQIEDPTAPSGSLQEVLHPQDVERINFDTLDEFLVLHPPVEPPILEVDNTMSEEFAE